MRSGWNAPPSNSYSWCTRVWLLNGVEEVLRGKSPHVGRSIGSKPLRSPHVALSTALDFVKDDAGYDDQEDAAESAAEGDKHDEAVGEVFACLKR